MKILCIKFHFKRRLIIEKLNFIPLVQWNKIYKSLYQNKENHLKKVKKYMLKNHKERIYHRKMVINYLYNLKNF